LLQVASARFAASGLPPDLPPLSRAYPGFCASAEPPAGGPGVAGRIMISPAKVDQEAAAVRRLRRGLVPCSLRTRRVLTNLKALAVSVRADLVGNADSIGSAANCTGSLSARSDSELPRQVQISLSGSVENVARTTMLVLATALAA
jgi:hypothetical protein